MALPYLFDFWAMPHQVPPDCDWRAWVILGGRGAGKTRAGAEWVRSIVEGVTPNAAGAKRRIGLVAETYEQAREIMVFGESGILAVSPPDRRPKWIAGRRMLEWPNGATAQLFSAQDPEALRGPQFDAVWVDELGCAAIDKGTNQPNKFLDPKSSESQLPHYSNGMRDDVVQMQYLRAMNDHFDEPQNNPISVEYDGPMVDMARAHVWAWDARPFPYFPATTSLWSDGVNYARGHWLNGRASARSLADVVKDIGARSGVTQIDVSQLHGIVRGYIVDDVRSARAALQPLMPAYGFEAVERNGVLVFFNRTGVPAAQVTDDTLAMDNEQGTDLSLSRAPQAETTGRVQLAYIDGEADYQSKLSEAVQPDEQTLGVSRSEVPLVLSGAEGARIVTRWLQEARLATETAVFALPPSQNAIKAGDVVDLRARGHEGLYRIDRIDDAGLRKVEASRVDPEVYLRQELFEEGATLTPHVGPTPVEMLFMDLPLLTGNEDPQAAYIASAARPWPGSVALYGSATDTNYVLQKMVKNPAVIGRLVTPLLHGPTGILDRQAGVQVKLLSGTLSSAELAAVYGGANTLAIGDGSTGLWEIVQFAQAELIGDRVFEISQLLRGQAGTSQMIQDAWPAGSFVVLMDGRPEQVALPSAALGLARHYRYGPAKQPLTAPSYKYVQCSFDGNGNRPYPVTHLCHTRGDGEDEFRWIRATRVGGDAWGPSDVPLAETAERYRVTVRQGGTIVREQDVTTAHWTYADAMRQADVGNVAYQVSIAQISDIYGPGPDTALHLNGLA